jgi:hypothetical protein
MKNLRADAYDLVINGVEMEVVPFVYMIALQEEFQIVRLHHRAGRKSI